MNGHIAESVRSVGRQVKFLAVPAAILAGWLALFGLSLAEVSRPSSLQEAIQKAVTHRGNANDTSAAKVQTAARANHASPDDDS